MLFGQWEDENDRQRRQIKTKMYKEMLDNQILINERYKRENKNNKQFQADIKTQDKSFQGRKQHTKNDSNLKDLDLTFSNIRTKKKYINLPSIKDKNTYYQGSSKFIKVQDQPPKPASQSPFRTQLIEEEEDDLDEYNNTCQKIIRELKSINKQTPKMKYRRKLYEYSDLAPNRKRYENTKIEEIKKSDVELYNRFEYSKPTPKQDQSTISEFSGKSKFGSDDRVPTMISSKETESDISRFKTEKNPSYKIKFKKQELPANEFQQVSRPTVDIKTHKIMTQPSQTSVTYSKKETSTKVNPLQRNRIQSNVQMAKNNQKTIEEEDRKSHQQAALADNINNLKTHKQTFINLLRKVKNRGQSLFIKLNAFPKSETDKIT